MNDRKKRAAFFALIAAALIWGGALILQGRTSHRIPPLLFNALRSFVGGIFLLLLRTSSTVLGSLRRRKRRRTSKSPLPDPPHVARRSVMAGLACGALLSCSLNLQQLGLFLYPDGISVEARCGFLCSLHVIFVPLLTCLLGKKVLGTTWISVILAGLGIYLLCLWEGFEAIYTGDLLMLLSALFFAFLILSIAKFGEGIDAVLMIVTQFLACGGISLIFSLLTERIDVASLLQVLPTVIGLGVFASGIAYPLQWFGQRHTDPTVSSVSLSLESVFATLGGWLFLGHGLTLHEAAGCALMLFAILLTQFSQGIHLKRQPTPKE